MPNYKDSRIEDEHKELCNNIKKKVQTTMIGALSSIEDHFSFLWQDNPEMLSLYHKLRSEILDKGNKQIRYIDIDLSNYSVIKKEQKVIPTEKQ